MGKKTKEVTDECARISKVLERSRSQHKKNGQPGNNVGKHIVDLPIEILQRIFDQLKSDEQHAIRATCHHFRTVDDARYKHSYEKHLYENQQKLTKCIITKAPTKKSSFNLAALNLTIQYVIGTTMWQPINYGYILTRILSKSFPNTINNFGMFKRSISFERVRDSIHRFFECVHSDIISRQNAGCFQNKFYFIMLMELTRKFKTIRYQKTRRTLNQLSIRIEMERMWFNNVWTADTKQQYSSDNRYVVLTMLAHILNSQLRGCSLTSVWTTGDTVFVYGRYAKQMKWKRNSPKIMFKITLIGSPRIIHSLMKNWPTIDVQLMLNEELSIFINITSTNCDEFGPRSQIELNFR